MDVSPFNSPKFRDDLPRYPGLYQLIRITAATVPGPVGVTQPVGSSVLGPILYIAFTEQLRTDGLIPRDREPCLADDVRGLGATPGFYHGRLSGSFNGLPVYEIIAEATSALTTDFINKTVNFITSVVNFNNTTVNVVNGSTFIFGTTTSTVVAPPGIFSKPTQLVTGPPAWTPSANTYPLLWGAYDHIEWEYDGLIRTPGSATPGDTGWRPFVDVGRTPVNDANYGCITIDRIIAYIAISAPRVVFLPPANSMPPGFMIRIIDESGSATTTNTISARRSGSDTVNRAGTDVVAVNSAFGGAMAETDGVSNWTLRQTGTPADGGDLAAGHSWEWYPHVGPKSVFACEPTTLSSPRKMWRECNSHTDGGWLYYSVAPNILYLKPLIVPTGFTIDKLMVELHNKTSTVDGSCKMIMGIYETIDSFGQRSNYPTKLILKTEERNVSLATAPKQIVFRYDSLRNKISFTPKRQRGYHVAFTRAIETGSYSVLDWTGVSLTGGNSDDFYGPYVDPSTGALCNKPTHIILARTYDSDLPDPFPPSALPQPVANDGSINHHPAMLLWPHHDADDPDLPSADGNGYGAV